MRIPMRLEVLPNLRLARMTFSKLVAQTRRTVLLSLQSQALAFRREWLVMRGNPRLRLQVLQVRSGPVRIDDDNCTSAFKPVRDAIAQFFNIDDGRRDRWVWLPCDQQLGDFGVCIHLQVVIADEAPPTAHGLTPEEFWKQHDAHVAKKKRAKLKPTPNVRKPR